VPGRKDDAPLLGRTHAGRTTAVGGGGAPAYLHKHQGAVRGTHDQIDFSATASGGSIIAAHQLQPLRQQIAKRPILSRVPQLFGGRCCSWSCWKETHMSASFTSALSAAKEAAGAQHYPQGALYVVATPIGNLADISLRALHLLALADTIACEDTRHTQQMLRAYGIDKTSSQLLAVHQHNEAQAATNVVDRLRQDQRVAYVSDAGTPGVSDPGARLVAHVRSVGLRCIPLPGASSVITALCAAGIADSSQSHGGFVFRGFLSSKATERTQEVLALAEERNAVVLLEAPHRIEALATALAPLGERLVTVGRELTKQFEEIATVSAASLVAWLAEDPNRLRGEFALVLHPAPAAQDGAPDDRVLKLLLEQLPLKTAVKLASDITGEARNALYDRALALKQES
jgi:16S rRNA (cytidine1402-2'-O)-methyltransferase